MTCCGDIVGVTTGGNGAAADGVNGVGGSGVVVGVVTAVV